MKILKTALVLVIVGLGHYAILGRVEHSREASPSDEYVAIWFHRPYQLISPPFGTGSDSPCFVRIEDQSGTSMGEIRAPLLQVSSIEWGENGAAMQNVGEWNFSRRQCYYWSDDGEEKIFVKGGRRQK